MTNRVVSLKDERVVEDHIEPGLVRGTFEPGLWVVNRVLCLLPPAPEQFRLWCVSQSDIIKHETI